MTVPHTLWDKLRRSIDGEVRADNATLALYAADASVYRQVPLGVVIPRHEADVMRTLGLARENQLPILAARRRHGARRPGLQRGDRARFLQVHECD